MPEEMCSLKFQLALNSTEMPEDSSQVPTLLLTSICEQLKPYATLRADDIEGSDIEPTTLRADDFEGRRL